MYKWYVDYKGNK